MSTAPAPAPSRRSGIDRTGRSNEPTFADRARRIGADRGDCDAGRRHRGRPHLDGQAKRFERVDTSKIDKSLIKAILSDHDVNVIVEMPGPSATARGGSRVQQVAVARRLKTHQDTLGARSGSSAARSRPSTSTPTTASSCASRAARSPPSRSCPASRRSTRSRPTPWTTAAACRSSAPRRCGRTSATPATGRRSLSSTAASTTPTPTSAGRAPRRRTTPTTRRHRGRHPSRPRRSSRAGTSSATTTTQTTTDGTESPPPDPDPLDCNGHGSHVAGTAAGFGVKSDHTTYTGPYNSTTYATSFGIGPGVAPKAKLVVLKVFGCDGATNVADRRLEWVGDVQRDPCRRDRRGQHVDRRRRRRRRPGRPGQQRAGGVGRRRRRLGQQRRPQRVHDRLAGQRHRASSPSPRRTPSRASRARRSTARPAPTSTASTRTAGPACR